MAFNTVHEWQHKEGILKIIVFLKKNEDKKVGIWLGGLLRPLPAITPMQCTKLRICHCPVSWSSEAPGAQRFTLSSVSCNCAWSSLGRKTVLPQVAPHWKSCFPVVVDGSPFRKSSQPFYNLTYDLGNELCWIVILLLHCHPSHLGKCT